MDPAPISQSVPNEPEPLRPDQPQMENTQNNIRRPSGLLSAALMVVIIGAASAFGGYLYANRFGSVIPSRPRACTTEAKLCPDGTSVSRTGPNCDFTPCPAAASAATAGWKTYTNTKYGYTLRYPPDWSVVKGQMEGQPEEALQTLDTVSINGASKQTDANTGMVMTVSVNPTDNNGSKIECATVDGCQGKYLAALGNTKYDTVEKTVQGSVFKGFRYEMANPLYSQNFQYYFVMDGKNIFVLSFTANNYSSAEAASAFDPILSTFTFTGQDLNSNPSKTCTYKGKIYTTGEGFKDSCNTCSCDNGQVACTLMVCQ